MSDDQEAQEEPAAVDEQPTDHEPEQTSEEDRPEKDLDEPSFRESLAADDRDWRVRSESLRGLFGPSGHAGRDWIGQVSNRVSGGGVFNQAGGDLTVNLLRDTGGVDVAYLHRDSADALLGCLVDTRSLKKLSRTLEREAVVFLRGREGTGRTTAALASLIQWVRRSQKTSSGEDEERIGRLHVMDGMSRGSFPDLRPGYGYLLDSTHGNWVRDVDYLRDLAVKSECKMVVLVSHRRTNLSSDPVDHDPPSVIDVFHRAFEYEARAAAVEPLLTPGALEGITQDLAGESSPGKAIGLAREVVQLLEEDRSPDEILDELPKRLSDHIRSRLGEDDPIVGRCFMAGVAVLNELPEATVSKAALQFVEHIYEAWNIKEENRTPPTWEELPKWLEYAGAAVSVPTRPGDSRIVRLNRRNAPATAIRVLWEDHPTVREPLLRWLCELGEGHSDYAVQIKAAHAVGKLATLDFDLIHERVLLDWSGSRKSHDHRLAALALEAAAQEPEMAPRVRDHLRFLASDSRYGPRAVAIQAYGSSIGTDSISEALQVLRRVSISLNIRLNRDAARSIEYLYSARTASMIVGELASWVGVGSPGGRHTAALAFVRLAMPARSAKGRPAPVALNLTEELVSLWHNALTMRIGSASTGRPHLAVPDAWNVLGEWLNRYDKWPEARPVIEQVIQTISPRARSLYLRLWQRRGVISLELYVHLVRLAKEG